MDWPPKWAKPNRHQDDYSFVHSVIQSFFLFILAEMTKSQDGQNSIDISCKWMNKEKDIQLFIFTVVIYSLVGITVLKKGGIYS